MQWKEKDECFALGAERLTRREKVITMTEKKSALKRLFKHFKLKSKKTLKYIRSNADLVHHSSTYLMLQPPRQRQCRQNGAVDPSRGKMNVMQIKEINANVLY